MNTQLSSRPFSLWLLMVALLLLSFGGFYGGLAFMAEPSGNLIGMSPDMLGRLPVRDYFLPGLFLAGVYGLGSLFVVYGLWARPAWSWLELIHRWTGAHWAWVAALTLGVVLIVWILVQVSLLGYQAPIQLVMGILGVVITGLTAWPSLKRFYVETAS